MHIALITHHYEPEVGAPQRRWGALIPRFVAAGHRVTVLAPSPHYPGGRAPELSADLAPGASVDGRHGERILRLRFREHGPGLPSRAIDQSVAASHAVTRGVRELRRRAERPDVLVATVPGIPSIGAGMALHRLLRVPLVVEMRDAWPDLIEPSGMMGPRDGVTDAAPGATIGVRARTRHGWQGALTAQAHRVITRFQRDADAVVTTTDAFADILRERGMKRIEVIRNGAYVEEIPHLGPRADDAAPLRIVYVGTVGRSQGLATAVRASAVLQQRGVPVEVRIVGGGVDLDHLAMLARNLSAPVELVGPVPRAEVFDHYRWAHSLLVALRAWVPLEWTVPSKLYELMATGRHVTGLLAGEAASIVRATGAGDVVAPEDPTALADLWEGLAADRDRLTVGPGGRAWALEHSNYERLAGHYLDLLTDLVR